MRDKLEKILSAYADLEKKLADPAVVSDPKEYARIAKEHADQAELVELSRSYIDALDDIEAAKELLSGSSDAEEKEMLQADISVPSLKTRLKSSSFRGTPMMKKIPSLKYAPV